MPDSLRRALLAAPLLLAGCGGAGTRLRIGYQPNGVLLAAKQRLDIGRALGPLARVQWTPYASGATLIDGLSVGRIDMGGTGDTPPLVAQSEGAHVVAIAAQPVSGAAAAILVPADSKLATPADLRGKRLAWLRGSSAQRFVTRALLTAGIDMASVEAINLAPAAAAAAFRSGAIDAWAVWDPWFAEFQEAGARVLVDGDPLAASNSFILANADYARDHPGLLTRALDALAGTARWAAGHRAELAALFAATGMAPAVAGRVAARQDLALSPLTAGIVAEQQALADALAADRLLPGKLDVAAAMWREWRGAPM